MGKFIAASFPATFGTPDGDILVDFCQRHKLPLLWTLGDALVHNTAYWKLHLPIPAGAPRLLDPATLAFTNMTKAPGDRVTVTWARLKAAARPSTQQESK